jgi:endonuclease III
VNDCARQMRVCARILKRHYGLERHGNKSRPLDDLIYILLSRQTTEVNFKRAYLALRRGCRSWNRLLKTPTRAVFQMVGSAGFGRARAAEIKGIADRLYEDFGRVTLEPLRRMRTAAAERYLTSLPGVGKKTARCVLMYSLDRKVFPVDVHCFRVLNRIGAISCKEPIRRHEDEIQAKVPPQLRFALHVTLVSLGRDICHVVRPECNRCPIATICAFRRRESARYTGGQDRCLQQMVPWTGKFKPANAPQRALLGT